MDCFYAGALKLGFSPTVAREMVAGTFYGSAMLAAKEKDDFKVLVGQVASKGGTTRAGLDVLEVAKLNKLIDKTFAAAASRAKALSDQLSKE
jgi:pyrroline-5-carboxylate reductase